MALAANILFFSFGMPATAYFGYRDWEPSAGKGLNDCKEKDYIGYSKIQKPMGCQNEYDEGAIISGQVREDNVRDNVLKWALELNRGAISCVKIASLYCLHLAISNVRLQTCFENLSLTRTTIDPFPISLPSLAAGYFRFLFYSG